MESFMNELLPLKRIFIGLVANITAGFAVTAAGTVDKTVLKFPDRHTQFKKGDMGRNAFSV